MDFSPIAKTWAMLGRQSKMWIITEPERWDLAKKIKGDNLPFVSEIWITQAEDFRQNKLSCLGENDLLLILLTVDGFMNRGHRDLFPLFPSQQGWWGSTFLSAWTSRRRPC